MKLITLRIDEEEKARLEQLAEQRNVTLSRALREGAALYLGQVRERVHRARGGETTAHGLRRRRDGTPINVRSEPSPGESATVASLRAALHERALGRIREAWQQGEKPTIILAAIGQWLSLVGWVYASNDGEAGWDWFLRDYCVAYAEPEQAAELRREIRGALFQGTMINVGTVLEDLSEGFLRLLEDAEHQELVRRAILPTWTILEREWLVED